MFCLPIRYAVLWADTSRSATWYKSLMGFLGSFWQNLP